MAKGQKLDMGEKMEVLNLVKAEMDRERRREDELRANAATHARNKQIIGKLEELGGKTFNDDDIIFQGNKLVLPEGTSIGANIVFLQKKEAELERTTEFVHVFNYRPYDGAYCMWNALKRTFGIVGHKDRLIKTMFGTEKAPPMMIDIPIDVGQREQVPWGRFELPSLPGAIFEAETEYNQEKGPLFILMVEAPKKYKFAIEGIFELIETELREHSLYRGKAFDGQDNPEFIDIRAVDPKKVVYSEEVMAQLTANIWAQLRHTAEFERLNIPLKRAVLLHGPFGTGKTLAALLTGQEAVANGWTFIKARPGRDNIFTVMQTAKLYEPCVVFYEDIDQIADASEADREGVAQLLDVFDGIEAKNTRILCVLTTNYPEKIHKGMARPGRLDAMIEINDLDQQGVEKLVRTRVEHLLADEIDWVAVFEAAHEYKPAFVTEFADRTMRYVIARKGTVDGEKITTEDLCAAAHGLRPQYEKMVGAKETADRDPIMRHLEEIAERAVRENVRPDLIVQNGH